jgi:hypothetical protein
VPEAEETVLLQADRPDLREVPEATAVISSIQATVTESTEATVTREPEAEAERQQQAEQAEHPPL